MRIYFSSAVLRFTWILLIIFLFGFIVKSNQPEMIGDSISPVITEFMAANSSGLLDEDNDFSDWIEIYNPTEDTIQIQGWFLTDDVTNPVKWIFPEYKLAPDTFLIVFLSGKAKEYTGGNIHANFRLDASGEYIALIKPDGITKAWYFTGVYPKQYDNVSYATIDGKYKYTSTPTPGEDNIEGIFFPEPVISVPHGFYTDTIDVEITSLSESGDIFYTLDGTSPIEGNKIKYTEPLHFDSTALLRAVVMNEGVDTGISITQSYIYLEHVLKQPELPKGYPEMWGPYTESYFEEYAEGDYEMDPEIVNDPEYKDSMVLSLLSIPSISIVTNKDHFFLDTIDDELGGIYIYTGPPITDTISGLGKEWERPASVEYIIPNSSDGFQVNCGVQLNGGHSRRPEKCPKHSIRLLFKNEYGPVRLDYNFFDDENAAISFDRLILRGGFNNTWSHWDRGQRERAQFIHDSWGKDTQLAMGHVAAHNKFAHLYINGLYWGLYNISERIDDEFLQSYYGGNDEDYDVIKDYTEPLRGNLEAWRSMGELLDTALFTEEIYQRLLGNNPDGTPNPEYEVYVDPISIIDYMLINFYAGNTDWDYHNWISARNRADPGTGFKFFIWDAEHIFEGLNHNVTGKYNHDCPSWVFNKMLQSEEFKKLLEERINLHFYNDGVLTPHSVIERWQRRVEEVRLAVMGESARWGDYRVYSPYNLHEDWNDEYEYLMSTYFPQRTAVVLEQLKEAGMFPEVQPPIFSKDGGIVEKGFQLSLSSNIGTIFYTLDGTDPKNENGSYAPGAIMYVPGRIVIDTNITVTARTQYGNEWSVITSESFQVETTGIESGQITINNIDVVNIFPNPSTKTVNIEYYLIGNSEVSISIYNSNGLLIEKFFKGFENNGWHMVSYEIEDLAEGIYIIQILDGQHVKNQKMVIRR